MALATAKLFVEEGAYVFITGRHQNKLGEAVKVIGRNVTGVQGDAANLVDLDRLYVLTTVKREKGRIDVLFASAGLAVNGKIGEITEEDFDTQFNLNVRGTLFTVQKALPLFTDGGSFIDVPAMATRDTLLKSGMSAAYADASLELMAAMKENLWDDVSLDVESVLGRKATRFEEWARHNAAAFA